MRNLSNIALSYGELWVFETALVLQVGCYLSDSNTQCSERAQNYSSLVLFSQRCSGRMRGDYRDPGAHILCMQRGN